MKQAGPFPPDAQLRGGYEFLAVDDRLIRGPQPDLQALQVFKNHGLRTVVNLREESNMSRKIAIQTGLNYYDFAIPDWTTPYRDQVDEFLQLCQQKDLCKILVHCWGGVGRTGVYVSCYRMKFYQMPVQDAIDLSDLETPHLKMNGLQRDWLHEHAPHYLKQD